MQDVTHALVFPRIIRSETSPEIKSSSEGPPSSVWPKLLLDGVAKERTFAGARHGRLKRRKELIPSVPRDMSRCRGVDSDSVPITAVTQQLEVPYRASSGLSSSSLIPRHFYKFDPMNALSRREEETLLKTTKVRALKECDPVVKGLSARSSISYHPSDLRHSVDFAECATGRTVSVAWACREKYKRVQDCMVLLYVC